MESLRLDGTTIRGMVKGRPVNCVVRSVPDGLVLPPGQYVLRVGENNPIYGLFLSVEAAIAPGVAPAVSYDKFRPSAMKDSPAAVATLVPTTADYATVWKLPPHRIAPAAHKIAPAAKFDTPAVKIEAPAAKFDAPAAKFDAPASKFDAPAVKIAPASKIDAPAAKFDAPAAKFDAPASKAVDAPAIKLDFVPGQGMTARVIIAVRPIGQNSLIAQAGFSDLVDVVQQAGSVTLFVS